MRPGIILQSIQGATAIRQFSALLDRAFEVPVGRHYLEDFPVWDPELIPEGGGIHRLGAFQAVPGSGGGSSVERLVASAGARLAWLRTAAAGPTSAHPHSRLKVALIGAVATDPAWRGQGLASELVTRAVEWARRQGAAAVFLWGSEHSLYGRLGFELCGSQATFPLAELGEERADGEPVREGWTAALFDALVSRREEGLELMPEDRVWIDAQKSVRWYWLGPVEKPRAYAAIGRGIDLTGLVHEWGGKPSDVKRLLGRIGSDAPGAALLGAPRLISRSGLSGRMGRAEFLCLARILDLREVLAAYGLPLAAGQKAPKKGLCRYLFGPETGASGSPPGCLGLPLWFWGLDAV